MEKRNLFEQMNASAYDNSTDPFSFLSEAGHFSNAADYTGIAGDADPDTESWREGEPAKLSHKLTPEEIESWRHKLENDEAGTEADFEQPISGVGHGRQRNQEVPLKYGLDADKVSVTYDPLDDEGIETGRFAPEEDKNQVEDDIDHYFSNLDDPDAILGEHEPGPGGEEDTGTVSTKLPSGAQVELTTKLQSPMTNKELLKVLVASLKKVIEFEQDDDFLKS